MRSDDIPDVQFRKGNDYPGVKEKLVKMCALTKFSG